MYINVKYVLIENLPLALFPDVLSKAVIQAPLSCNSTFIPPFQVPLPPAPSPKAFANTH